MGCFSTVSQPSVTRVPSVAYNSSWRAAITDSAQTGFKTIKTYVIYLIVLHTYCITTHLAECDSNSEKIRYCNLIHTVKPLYKSVIERYFILYIICITGTVVIFRYKRILLNRWSVIERFYSIWRWREEISNFMQTYAMALTRSTGQGRALGA